ncbi:lytic transglycosylase domain-containing protein [Sphingomonas nostoxanthinifaciens]|uniref:lytic transglycosylase domain-containing protein n=1 Tax=Sphingomonas nostoxanthinifaciens TaxID=2872652 RepID=UPI001CC1D091|nr:lytic transglycosylase domain-containing protein [Sphingomonas nostoxanthinifaciens]UAK25454.1 lytic transglycosylase domain-containing protein [Sphingomonas nostoxanthinifaciens]
MALVRVLCVAALAVARPAHAEAVADWRRTIDEASSRFGIPTSWIERVMQAESRARTTVMGKPIRSRAGAMGLMQLMPATWSQMRQTLGLGANPDNPRDNILAGTFYLRWLYQRFGYPGLFAAYNAGPTRYADYLASGRALPSETTAYLAKVGEPPQAVPDRPAETLFAIRRDANGASEKSPSPIFVVQK